MDALPADTSNTYPVTVECIQHASNTFQIHPDVLYALLIVEGGTVGKVSYNTNGTYDMGPAQINSTHLPRLTSMGFTEKDITYNGCVNVYVQAMLVKEATNGVKMHKSSSYLRTLARYHSKTPKYNIRYAEKLKRAFLQLYTTRRTS